MAKILKPQWTVLRSYLNTPKLSRTKDLNALFTKKNKEHHIWTSTVTPETKIKTTTNYYFTPTWLAWNIKYDSDKRWHGWEQQQCLHTAGASVNWHNHFAKCLALLNKVEYADIIWSRTPSLFPPTNTFHPNMASAGSQAVHDRVLWWGLELPHLFPKVLYMWTRKLTEDFTVALFIILKDWKCLNVHYQ